MDRRTSEQGPAGGIRRMDYDRGGRLVREVLPQEEAQKGILANGYTYHYDSAGRRTAAVGPDGTLLERRVYDSAGNLAELYDGVELGGEPQTDTNVAYPTQTGQAGELSTDINVAYRTQTEQAGEPQTDTNVAYRTQTEQGGEPRTDTNAVHRTQTEQAGELSTDINVAYRTQTEQAGEPRADTVHPADKETQTACTRYAYDLAGRRTLVETPGGSRQEFWYDAFGNLTATKDGMGNLTRFQPDAWGRITKITRADGSVEQYAYDVV